MFTAHRRCSTLRAGLAVLTVVLPPLVPSFAFAANSVSAVPSAPVGVREASNEIKLASHRAVYELTLLKSTGSKSPTAASGRIAFDFSGSPCDGYVQNFRQLTELQPAEGPSRLSDMHSATFEGGDGANFAFKMQTTVDNGAPDVVDGKARKSSDGALSIDLSKPTRTKLDLAYDIVFPTEHLKRILTAAEEERSFLEVKVYDGSETGEKIFETTTIIGRAVAAPAVEPAAHVPTLEHLRRWPVTISYFESGKKDEGPNYILSFDLYENGVSRALRLDYGDFVLAGEMTSLEFLPEQACRK